MINWVEDKKWSDKFLIEIKKILGEILISEAPIKEDIYHNTDLMVLELKPYRIACRIRRNYYYKLYSSDITIRSGRPNDTETELQKILNGWGDFMFYGFSNEDETKLKSWTLISLNKLRSNYNNSILIHKNNRDNSSSFVVLNKQQIQDTIIANSS